MEITYCEGCNTKYNIGGLDEGSRFKCKQCGAVITVAHDSDDDPGNDFDFSDLGLGDEKSQRKTKRDKADKAEKARAEERATRGKADRPATRGKGGGREARAPRAAKPATPVPFLIGIAMAAIGVILVATAPRKSDSQAWEAAASAAGAELADAKKDKDKILTLEQAEEIVSQEYSALTPKDIADQLRNKDSVFQELTVNTLDRGVGAIPRAGREQGDMVRTVSDKMVASCVTVFRQTTDGSDPRTQLRNSAGVIVGNDGSVVTDYGIAANQKKLVLLISSGDLVTATIVGGDAGTNVALLQIDDFARVKQLVGDNCVASFGSSAGLATGDQLIIFGAPHGLHASVSVGFASQPRRYMPVFTVEPYNARVGETFNYIQFDASMHVGSRGAPVCDARGNVVGIASAKYSGYQLIGFAVPSEAVQRAVRNIRETAPLKSRGELPWDTRWSWIGAYFDIFEPDLTKPLRDKFHPLKVTFVSMGTSAEAEGLKPGDLVVSIDGEKVDAVSEEDLPRYTLRIAETAPGATITLEVERDGKMRTFKMKADPRSPFSGTRTELWRLGIVITQATPAFAERMNLQNVKYGVYVIQNQCAKQGRYNGVFYQLAGQNIVNAAVGMRWTIIEINGKKITSVGEMIDIYNELDEKDASQSISAKAIDTTGRTVDITFPMAAIEDLVR